MTESNSNPDDGTDRLSGRPRELLTEMLAWEDLDLLATVTGTLLFDVLAKSGRSMLELQGRNADGDPVFALTGCGPVAVTLERAAAGVRTMLEGQADNSPAGTAAKLSDQPQDRIDAFMQLLGLCLKGIMPDGPAADGRAQYCVMVWDQPGVVHFNSNVRDRSALAAALVRSAAGLYEPSSIITHD